MTKTLIPSKFEGTLKAPASKSDAQRAILAASYCFGISRISNIGTSDDVKAMIHALSSLGVKCNFENGDLIVDSRGKFIKEATISIGESGLGFRLFVALLAVLDGRFTLSAEGSLNDRSQKFILNDLNSWGCIASGKNGFPPIHIEGKISTNNITVNGSQSSQFISGLLMALPLLGDKLTLKIEELKSSPYVKMTLATLHQFGVDFESKHSNQFEISNNHIFSPCNYLVEGDWSGASLWIVASALSENIIITGLSDKSFQADKELLSALENANCLISKKSNGINIDGSNRIPFNFDATDCPDLFPALVLFAASCNGVSKIKGTHRLVNKESNRAIALIEEYSKLGLQIKEENDSLIINGKGKLNGGNVSSHNDHRIAMSLGLASIIADEEIILDNSECVNKSYPEFWNDFDSLKILR